MSPGPAAGAEGEGTAPAATGRDAAAGGAGDGLAPPPAGGGSDLPRGAGDGAGETAPGRWRELASVGAAFAFLTRLPLPRWAHAPQALDGAVAYLPLVGVVVGGAAAAAYHGAALLWPAPLPALAAVVVAVLLTGGFHEDGLADTADAFAAGGGRARMRAVLDDSRVGPLGALALVLVVAAKVAALSALGLRGAAVALVAGHALGRWAIPALLWRLHYASGEGGVAARLAAGAGGGRLLVASLLAAAAAGSGVAWALPRSGPAAGALGLLLAVAALLTLALGILYRRRLGGVTGDLMGAACQLVELAVYLALLAALR